MAVLTDQDIAKFDSQTKAPTVLSDSDIAKFDSTSNGPDQPVEKLNPGSHPTWGPPEYNYNPFTSLFKGVNQGFSDIDTAQKNIVLKILGASPEDRKKTIDYVNSSIYKPDTIPESMPGTAAGITQDIGRGVISSAPAMAAASVAGPLGFGAAGAADAFSKDQNPFVAFGRDALTGKVLSLAGGTGTSVLSKLPVGKEFAKRAGSVLGGGLATGAASGGDPASIIQGASFGAVAPSKSLKKSDIIPFDLNNKIAYGMMKDYLKPWAKDFKYAHDPIRGWLNEKLTANNADDAATKAAQRKGEIGQAIGDRINNSSQAGITSDYSDVLKPIDDKLVQLNKSPKSNAAIITRLQNVKDDLMANHKSDMTPQEAFNFKSQADDLTKWTGNPGDDKPVNSALQDTYRNIRDIMNQQVPELKNLNQRYGDMSEATKRLQYRADASNPLLNAAGSVKDIGIAALFGHGNPALTAALIGAERVGKTAAFKTRVANMLYDRPNMVSLNNPNANNQVIQANAQLVHPPVADQGSVITPPSSETNKGVISLPDQNKVDTVKAFTGNQNPFVPKDTNKLGKVATVAGVALALGTGAAQANPFNANDIAKKFSDSTGMTKHFEGFKPTIYKDTEGHSTIGYGFNLDEPSVRKIIPSEVLNGSREITKKESDKIFSQLYPQAITTARNFVGKDVYSRLNNNRKATLIDMAYNMGPKLYGFTDMREALMKNDFNKAANEMVDSHWYKQVGNRSKFLVGLMKGK